MRQLCAKDLKNYLDKLEAKPILVDVREPWEYDICHINDSQSIPMNTIPNVVDQFDPNKEIVLICHHGVRSHRAALFLQRSGFDNIINLSDGINAWATDIDPKMATY